MLAIPWLDVNKKNKQGKTILMLHAQFGNLTIVEQLLNDLRTCIALPYRERNRKKDIAEVFEQEIRRRIDAMEKGINKTFAAIKDNRERFAFLDHNERVKEEFQKRADALLEHLRAPCQCVACDKQRWLSLTNEYPEYTDNKFFNLIHLLVLDNSRYARTKLYLLSDNLIYMDNASDYPNIMQKLCKKNALIRLQLHYVQQKNIFVDILFNLG